MKIVFLGTAAAEGVPGLWCKCQYCEHARKVGGKEIRRRCSYYVDDDTMIDFGPDSFYQALANHIYLPDLKRIIFTHPHGDHMSASELVYRRMPNFCSEDSQGQMLDLVASKETLREFVKENKLDEAVVVLDEGKNKTENEVLKTNWEHVVNNRIKRFSNAALGDNWYVLALEEVKPVKQRAQMPFGGPMRHIR